MGDSRMQGEEMGERQGSEGAHSAGSGRSGRRSPPLRGNDDASVASAGSRGSARARQQQYAAGGRHSVSPSEAASGGRLAPLGGDEYGSPPSGGRRTPPPLHSTRPGRDARDRDADQDEERRSGWRCGEYVTNVAEELGFSLFFRCYVGYHLICSIVFAVCWGYHNMMAASYRMYVPPQGASFAVTCAMLTCFVLIMTLAVMVIDLEVRLFVNWLGFARDSANLFFIPNGATGHGLQGERKCRRRRNYMLGLFELFILVVPFFYALISTLMKGESMLAFVGLFSFVGFVVSQLLIACLFIAFWVYSVREKFRVFKDGYAMSRKVKEAQREARPRGRRGDADEGSQAGSRAGEREETDEGRVDIDRLRASGGHLWMRRHRKNPLIMSEFGMDIFSARTHTVTLFLGFPWMMVMIGGVDADPSNIAWMMIIAVLLFGGLLMAFTIARPSKEDKKTARNQEKVTIICMCCFGAFGLVGLLGSLVAGVSGGGGMLAGFVVVLLLLTQGMMVRRHTLHVQTAYITRGMTLSPKPRDTRVEDDDSSGMTVCIPLVPCPNVWRSCCDCACLEAQADEDYIYNFYQMDADEGRVLSTESRTIVAPPRVPGFDNSFRKLKATVHGQTPGRLQWDDLMAKVQEDGGKLKVVEEGDDLWKNVLPQATLVEVNGRRVRSKSEAESAIEGAPEDFDVLFQHGVYFEKSGKNKVTREAHLDRSDRVLTADLMINTWYFLLFIAVAGFAFAYGSWYGAELKAKVAAVADVQSDPQTAIVGTSPYPACGLTWDAMDFGVVDFALLAALSYHSNLANFKSDLATWFGTDLALIWPPEATDPRLVEETTSRVDAVMKSGDSVPINWYDLYSHKWNRHVILIRQEVGSDRGRTWLRDVDIWGDAVLYQIMSALNPFWSLWDEDTVTNFVSFLGVFKKPLVEGEFHKDIEDYIKGLNDRMNGTFILTGHAAAGGHAKLIAQKMGLPVVTFAPPGTRWSSERLGIPTPLDLDDVSISPARSMMSMVDRANGFVQQTHCPSASSMTDCQRMEYILCDLLHKCGDPKSRMMAGSDPAGGKCDTA
eukprot:TRINITY_DN46884_c0_g1_i1.p1 TRINITY_DN46884_c0_g1~~TRINITY_DN46884_c0_g1_i1.p1  ORF type:complete len:1061 (+),score=315.66 TRINITY_DN46884_c0_g1_i1:85-3267(+)